MEFKKNKFRNITAYILAITISFILSVMMYKLTIQLSVYFLFVTIPMLFLSLTLGIFNIIKLILTLVSFIFGRNDNTEVLDFIGRQIENTNRICKYTIIAVFASLLFSVMVLDIILCLSYGKTKLVAISIIIWIMLYYLLFTRIVKLIKKEIRL